jgi:phosphatidylglycerophosphatase A
MGWQNLKIRFARIVAEFFYCGRFPVAPGTVGSLGSLVIWIPSVYCAWPITVRLAMLGALFFLGVWASRYAIDYYQQPDPKQVVIDEVVGQGIPFLVISPNLWQVVFSFLLFRFFDIVKPWPIRTVEHSFRDQWGIMLDDVIAGIFAMMVLFIGKYFFIG